MKKKGEINQEQGRHSFLLQPRARGKQQNLIEVASYLVVEAPVGHLAEGARAAQGLRITVAHLGTVHEHRHLRRELEDVGEGQVSEVRLLVRLRSCAVTHLSHAQHIQAQSSRRAQGGDRDRHTAQVEAAGNGRRFHSQAGSATARCVLRMRRGTG